MKVRVVLAASAALLMASMSAQASDTVNVNGQDYYCQTRCEVTTYSNGTVRIRDAYGGICRPIYAQRQ